MGLWYDPESRLDTLLEIIIQEYETDRERYWSDDENAARLRKVADRLAHIVVDSSEDTVLRMPDGATDTPWAGLQEIIRDFELSDEIRAKVEIIVAWRFATDNRAIAERCLQLADLALRQRPSERILRLLRRLGRCYVAGLYPETTMICRGVLENVVDDALGRLQLTMSERMRDKLATLVTHGALSPERQRDAWTVWQRGNTAIHKDPEAVGHAFETIKLTMNTLVALSSSRDTTDAG